MRFRSIALLCFALPFGASFGSQISSAQSPSLTVFAAASMKNALDEANLAYTKASGINVTVSYASSSALIKQIEQGAPADVFISADIEWMDYGAQKKVISETGRTNLLGNRLVLIAPKQSPVKEVEIGPGFDLASLAGNGRIAIGNVRAVPAGKYAKAALEELGVWDATAPKLAMAENVRAALTLVARNEAPLGIVYASDAKAEPEVKVLGTFPEGSHPPIVYPVAMTAVARSIASGYLDFLRSQTARAVFERHGFAFLGKPVS